MMIGNVVADIAVIFKTSPTKDSVAKLAEKVVYCIRIGKDLSLLFSKKSKT